MTTWRFLAERKTFSSRIKTTLNYYTTTDEADQLSKTPVSIYSVVVVAMVIIDVFLV
jgi:hypothetical protein